MLRSALSAFAAVTTAGLTLIAGLVGLIVVIAAAGSAADGTGSGDSLPASYVFGDRGNSNKLLAIPITGVILGEKQERSLFGVSAATYGYEIKEKLEAAAKRSDIDGIVLEMDTPGGTIFGSRAIADAVRDYQASTGQPVVAFVRGIAASGGMYAMADADAIVADHGTLVGSIGVIFGPISYYDGLVATEGGLLGGGVQTRNGITVEYITAGRGKDVGSPYRPLADEERRVLQQAVDASYEEFVARVASGRDLDVGEVIDDVGALIYDEQTAVTKGLVDEVASRDRAYELAAERAGLDPGNYQVVRLDQGPAPLFALGARFGLDRGGEATDAWRDAGSAGVAASGLCLEGPRLLALSGPVPRACGN
ncbi:MAG: S49 family peptidase [Acidimicrobiia bacterium]|nr:S49 family peptidase [Acidimicrobiia bacterium]